MNFYIYETTYYHDGKENKYFGQRKCPKTKLPETDKYMGSFDCWPLTKGMLKEYPERFKKRIIVCGLNQKQADQIEIALISLTPYIPLEETYPMLRKYVNFHPGGCMGNVREATA